jgi:hypothetical protein
VPGTEGAIDAVSCPSEGLCVVVGKEGSIYVSTDPAAGQWQTAQLPGAPDLRAVSCSGVALCVAGDGGGNILTSTNPTGGGFAEANGGGSIQVTGLSCPTAGACVAVDENGDVLASTNPTGNASAWSFQSLVPFEAESPDTGQFVGNALWGTSCPTTSLCILVGAESRIFTSAEPFAAPSGPSTGSGSRTSGTPASKRTRLRPHTHLVYTKGFWKGAYTRHRHAKASFHFYSREGAQAFECKRDRGPWRRCHSPLRYWAAAGRHVLRVRAIGRTGLRGPVAELPFRIVRQRGSGR